MESNTQSSVVVILYPGCIFFEIALAVEMLSKKFQIIFATPNGEDHIASNGAVIRADVSYGRIALSRVKAVVIPGGDPGSVINNTLIDNILRDAFENKVLLAAICAGPLLLAKANVLRGKRIAHGFGKEHLEFLSSYFEGSVLTDEKVVWDSGVLTAKPEAYIDFAVELACKLGAADCSKAEATKNYYRGI